ncbi:hypothetical protein SDC9_161600 [bioreactor metagenome]|uniref:Uncharacterized protein n=1 Tax=bioreactor metagenome TaxID=1076179 RepID=A0A645FPV2_9ZZZZ
MGEVHAQTRANEHKGAQHIGCIAHKGDVEIFQLLANRGMFDHGQHIADHLSGMVEISETVDDGHGGVLGQ